VVRRPTARGTGVTTFAAGGVAGTLVAVAAKLTWDGVVDGVAGSTVWVTVLLIVAVVLLISTTVATSNKVDHLAEKASFSIRYCSADNPAVLYALTREVIAQAGPDAEVFAINSYVEVFKDSNDPEQERLQRNYLAAFEKKFETIKYHRLIQVKGGQRTNGGVRLADLLAPAYLDHYRRMAGYAEEHPRSRIQIEEVTAKLPTSFVVVKDENRNGGRIIWQMNKHDPKAESAEIEPIMGAFVINDPDGLLVPRFLEWFYEVDQDAKRLTIDMLGGDGRSGR
jgi:hypothetical protein